MKTSNSTVIIERLPADSGSLREQLSSCFEKLSLIDHFSSAKAVLLKPNLTYPRYKEGVTTRKEFITALISALRKINSTTRIIIGESDGGYNSFSMTDGLRDMGYYEMAKEFPHVEIINLSKVPAREVTLDTARGPFKIKLPELFFTEIDFSISCPVPKVHCMTGITLSFKNQWGCVPDVMRLKNHYIFDHIISRIAEILNFKYAFLDGRFGLNKNGPMAGEAIELNWFVASNSLGAFDITVAEMMGVDWKKIRHLKIASDYGLIPTKDHIEILGNIKEFTKKFQLKRNIWNYPALAAFYSKYLTHLFYFSKLAKPLHDFMYTFRKRPIDD
ncbi:MAG: DUF362 domain-containing protein [Vulcanimicrobiota bacterium]